MKSVVCLAMAACLTATATAWSECDEFRINEIRIDQPGADLDEYVEIAGTPGASLDGIFYIVIGDLEAVTPPIQNGGIEVVVNLSGSFIGANGLFVLGEPTLSLGRVNKSASLNFEQNDNVTHMLVRGFTGSLNQDLDTNNDGILDLTPWRSVLCSVALINNPTPNGITSEYFYSDVIVGPDFGDSTPSHAWLCSDTLEWKIGQFDPAAGTDTVGLENPTCGDVTPTDLQLSEIRVDQTGTDSDEYFELAGPSGESLDDVWVIVVGDASSGNAGNGVIEAVVDLSGNGIPGTGYFLVAEDNDTFGQPANLLADLNFENDDTVTFFLIRGFTGALNQDLDTNDDGILDATPWEEIIDSVAIVRSQNPPLPGQDWAYSETTVGPNGNLIPGHVYRCSTEGTWKFGQFDPVGGQDTPGAQNISCAFIPECGSSIAGNCFIAKETPNCNNGDCCDAVCAIDPFCCDEAWDENCVDTAQLVCLGCGDTLTGNCFEPHDGPYCSNGQCCELVCSIDTACCNSDWDVDCANLALQLCTTSGSAPPVIINEIRIDQVSTDNDEYFELVGPPGTSLDGVTYLVIGDGPSENNGVIEAVVSLNGQTIPSDGIFVVTEQTFTLVPFRNVDLILPGNGLNFENTDNVTHMLVFNFAGANNQDLDTDEDGVLDVTPWSEVMDSVAVLQSLTSGNLVYSTTKVGPDGSFTPSQIYRCTPAGDWTIGSFDSPGSTDTPGSANLACEGGPVESDCGLPESGNCYVAHSTPSCDTLACCEAVCGLIAECCSMSWDESCVSAAIALCGDPGVPPAGIVINEIRIDQEGTDNNEYFELKGPPGMSLNGLTYVVIGDGATALGSGVLETVISLDGEQIGANGLYLRSLNPNTFENSDNVTHLLVWGYSGANGTDLDFDDDGMLDIVSWVTSVDDVSLVENLSTPPVGTEWWYSPTTVGPDGSSVPGHAYRCTSQGIWTIGAFAPLGLTDTPGLPNLACSDECLVDSDGDGVNDCDDLCGGFNDLLDADLDGTPDGCESCLADLDNNGIVDGADLGLLLAAWAQSGFADLDANGLVDGADLGLLLASWGPCS